MSTEVKEVIEAVVGPSKEDVNHIYEIISDAWDNWVPPLEKNREWIHFQKALAAGENWAKRVVSSPDPWGEAGMRREAHESALKDFIRHSSKLLTDYLGLRITIVLGKDWLGQFTPPGSTRALVLPGIQVTIPQNYSKDDHSLLTSVITHELVHSGQWEKMRLNPKWDYAQYTQKINKRDLDKKKSGKKYTKPQFHTMASMDDYLNSKVELMPRARQHVDALRRSGLSNDEILQRLKGGIPASAFGITIHSPLGGQTHPQSKRRALRYAADYAQQ
jgi:hypothetical protein